MALRQSTICNLQSAIFLLLAFAGCGGGVSFPAQSLDAAAKSAGAVAAFDTKGGGKADFFMFADGAGRINRIGYDRAGDERRGLPTQSIGATNEYIVVVPKEYRFE